MVEAIGPAGMTHGCLQGPRYGKVHATTSPGSFEHAREAIEIGQGAGAQTAIAGGLYVRGYVRAVNGSPDEAEAD